MSCKRGDKLCTALFKFCWRDHVGFCLYILLSQKFSEKLFVSDSFFSHVSVLHAFNIILCWSFISHIYFLTHFFKEIWLWKQFGDWVCMICKGFEKWNAARQAWMKVAFIWLSYEKNMIHSFRLDVSFSLHNKSALCGIWLAFCYLHQLVSENLFHPFRWVNFSMFMIM